MEALRGHHSTGTNRKRAGHAAYAVPLSREYLAGRANHGLPPVRPPTWGPIGFEAPRAALAGGRHARLHAILAPRWRFLPLAKAAVRAWPMAAKARFPSSTAIRTTQASHWRTVRRPPTARARPGYDAEFLCGVNLTSEEYGKDRVFVKGVQESYNRVPKSLQQGSEACGIDDHDCQKKLRVYMCECAWS
jgi:hypothetical protein